MALVLADRIQQTGSANTTVSFTLSGAVTGFQSFAAVGNGNTTYYSATDTSGNWEVGIGTYSTTGPTLTRTTILSSSNAGSAVTFSGTVNVFVTYPSEKSINVDGSGNVQIAASGSTNYLSTFGGATTNAVQFQTLGTDTNISFAIQPKGTGAIDLAAGSSGVNISNGGTVTAITRTVFGSGYTTIPSVAISAPTTAGGVQAIAGTVNMSNSSAVTISGGGTGYTVNDVLTVVGGTGTAIQITVSAVSSGVITAATITNVGFYSVLPTNPVSVTGGTGSGATFTLGTYYFGGATITNAGSGYVEQPTVTFSGGGGSGAAAYATVGGVTTIKSLGSGTTSITLSSLQFYTPNTVAPALTLRDIGGADTGLLISPAVGYLQLVPIGAANATMMLASGGTNSIYFNTQGTSQTNQMRVAHTASAVNYVQVTGSVTSGGPIISAQGSDSNAELKLRSKGIFNVILQNGAGNNGLVVDFTSGATTANYFQMYPKVAGTSPVLGVLGTDANIDLTLTPKGTGRVNITTSIKPKVNSAANVTSPLAWDSTSYDEYAITALANALTINADANASPADGQKMLFRFKDNGTARALTWTTGSTNSFRVVGVTLPTTTVASKLVYVGCIYNAADSRWDAVAVSQEA